MGASRTTIIYEVRNDQMVEGTFDDADDARGYMMDIFDGVNELQLVRIMTTVLSTTRTRRRTK